MNLACLELACGTAGSSNGQKTGLLSLYRFAIAWEIFLWNMKEFSPDMIDFWQEFSPLFCRYIHLIPVADPGFPKKWGGTSSQATVFESVFYSLHTVAAWACLTSIAWIYYDLIRPIRWLPETTRPDTQRRSSSNEMTPFISRSVSMINKDMRHMREYQGYFIA